LPWPDNRPRRRPLSRAAGPARPNLTHSLKQGGGSGTGHGHARVRSALVVAEVALAFVLLTGAGLLIRSLNKLGNVDPGFDSTNVPPSGCPRRTGLSRSRRARRPSPAGPDALESLPGVTGVALTSVVPMQGWGYGMPFQIAGKATVDRANRSALFFRWSVRRISAR